jgi:hypothetical protein
MDHADIALPSKEAAIEKFRNVVSDFAQDPTDDAAIKAMSRIKMIIGAFPRQYSKIPHDPDEDIASIEILYKQKDGEFFLTEETLY